jgi:hypothetical protein
MRELEFLPDWYPTLRTKRRLIIMESWLAGAITVVLGLWLLFSARNVRAKEYELRGYQAQLKQANYDLDRLNEEQSLERQLSEQRQLVDRLGLHVPAGRLIDCLEQMMPKEMALRDFKMEFQQRQVKPVSPLALAAGGEPVMDRRLTVELDGVAPSDVDVGNFMIRLATIPHFGDSSMSTSDLTEYGHLMRDYKVDFSIDLSDGEH